MHLINLTAPPVSGQNYTFNKIFDLQDPLDNILLSKIEI